MVDCFEGSLVLTLVELSGVTNDMVTGFIYLSSTNSFLSKIPFFMPNSGI